MDQIKEETSIDEISNENLPGFKDSKNAQEES